MGSLRALSNALPWSKHVAICRRFASNGVFKDELIDGEFFEVFSQPLLGLSPYLYLISLS